MIYTNGNSTVYRSLWARFGMNDAREPNQTFVMEIETPITPLFFLFYSHRTFVGLLGILCKENGWREVNLKRGWFVKERHSCSSSSLSYTPKAMTSHRRLQPIQADKIHSLSRLPQHPYRIYNDNPRRSPSPDRMQPNNRLLLFGFSRRVSSSQDTAPLATDVLVRLQDNAEWSYVCSQNRGNSVCLQGPIARLRPVNESEHRPTVCFISN